MKLFLICLGSILAVISACTETPLPTCDEIEFDGGKMGRVVFDRKKHTEAGFECEDCHTEIFQKKRGSASMKPPHEMDRYCGVCHNGEDAPSVHGDCKTCHLE